MELEDLPLDRPNCAMLPYPIRLTLKLNTFLIGSIVGYCMSVSYKYTRFRRNTAMVHVVVGKINGGKIFADIWRGSCEKTDRKRR